MFLDTFFVIQEKIKIIQQKLRLLKGYSSVINICKNKISDNRILIILLNPNFNKYKNLKENSLITDNISFINKVLNTKINISNDIHIKELLFSFNFETNVYKIYGYYYNNIKGRIKILYSTDKNNINNINNIIYKKLQINFINNYKSILKKYSNIMNFKDYNYILVKKKNKLINAIFIELVYHNLELNYNNMFKKIGNNFNINEEIIKRLIKKYKTYKLSYISFSNDYINIYINL